MREQTEDVERGVEREWRVGDFQPRQPESPRHIRQAMHDDEASALCEGFTIYLLLQVSTCLLKDYHHGSALTFDGVGKIRDTKLTLP